MKQFDQKLFEFLPPNFPKVNIIEFGGTKKGDKMEFEFGFPIFSKWEGQIIENGQDDKRAWFVDKGYKVPFTVNFWEHQHICERIDEHNCIITDHIEFSSRFKLFNPILKLAFTLAFLPRKKAYQKYFS